MVSGDTVGNWPAEMVPPDRVGFLTGVKESKFFCSLSTALFETVATIFALCPAGKKPNTPCPEVVVNPIPSIPWPAGALLLFLRAYAAGALTPDGRFLSREGAK